MRIGGLRNLPLSLSLIIGCGNQGAKPLWIETNTMELKQQLTIGTSDIKRNEYVFGNVSDIKCDTDGDIYIADAGLFRIQKYSSNGTFERSFGMGNGREPGQFMRLMHIDVDKSKDVYATDYALRRITVFDSIGIVKNTIRVRMKPAQIIVGQKGSIYIIGNPMSYTGPLIHMLNLHGTFVKSFCKRDGIPDLALKSGNFGWLATDNDGNIYYTLTYPIEIRKFTEDGDLLARFTRPVPFLSPPIVVRAKGGMKKVWMGSGSMNLFALPDGKLVHLIYHRDRNKPEMYPRLYFDIFSRRGEWLLCVPLSRLGLRKYGTLGTDLRGGLYVNHRTPYSRVTKYSLTFPDNVQDY